MFLGEALTTMIVYVWCRRNPYVRYNFFGLFTFQAPYLPWILVLISVLFGGSVVVDLVGEWVVQLSGLKLDIYLTVWQRPIMLIKARSDSKPWMTNLYEHWCVMHTTPQV